MYIKMHSLTFLVILLEGYIEIGKWSSMSNVAKKYIVVHKFPKA